MKKLIGLFFSIFFLIASVLNAETADDAEAKKLYKKCAGCHGKKGTNKAFGRSAVISGQSVEDLVEKITFFKTGDFKERGTMRVMNKQTKKLSESQIRILAEYISKL